MPSRGLAVVSLAAFIVGIALLGATPPLVRAAEPAPAGAAKPVEPKVRVELLSEVAAITPGETFWLALRQEIASGWHTYWMNPGDSGEPPRIEWTLPSGFTAGDFAWPPPERIAVGPAMTYGYSKHVVLRCPSPRRAS
jgi:thiol:disulfide interchange protein DsbD